MLYGWHRHDCTFVTRVPDDGAQGLVLHPHGVGGACIPSRRLSLIVVMETTDLGHGAPLSRPGRWTDGTRRFEMAMPAPDRQRRRTYPRTGARVGASPSIWC